MTTRWFALALGVWVMLSPWLLGFSSIGVMMWSNLIAGLAIVCIHLWGLFDTK